MQTYLNGKSGKRIILRINSDGSVYVYVQNGSDVIKAADFEDLIRAWNKAVEHD